MVIDPWFACVGLVCVTVAVAPIAPLSKRLNVLSAPDPPLCVAVTVLPLLVALEVFETVKV